MFHVFRGLTRSVTSARVSRVFNSSKKPKQTLLHDPVEHVTGIEKKELLAHMSGDCDPFRILSIKRGPGTRDRPNLIPSAYDKRLVACSCRPEDNHLEFMWLHLGVPKRCGCGYWFELCPVAAFN